MSPWPWKGVDVAFDRLPTSLRRLRLARPLAGALCALLLIFGSALLSSVPASAALRPRATAMITIEGAVQCNPGPFVGVWIVSSGGGSGWAASHSGGATSGFHRTFRTALPTTITLHVGCTGSTRKWGAALSSSSRTVGGDATVDAFCSVGAGDCTLVPSAVGQSSDWAGSSFCSRYGVPTTSAGVDGVATCGSPYGPHSNHQGWIGYNGVTFDTWGFQCVEYADRYFYYVTGQVPPFPAQGIAANVAYSLTQTYPQYSLSPGGAAGGSDTFDWTIIPGDIISMWSAGDLVGHVGVVTAVSVSGGNGTITIADENAAADGSDTITVTNGAMQSGYFDDFQWAYGLPDPYL